MPKISKVSIEKTHRCSCTILVNSDDDETDILLRDMPPTTHKMGLVQFMHMSYKYARHFRHLCFGHSGNNSITQQTSLGESDKHLFAKSLLKGIAEAGGLGKMEFACDILLSFCGVETVLVIWVLCKQ